MIKNQSLYVLNVNENGKAFLYYCYIILKNDKYSWVLSRDAEKLSFGEGSSLDIDSMLNALCEDLALTSTNSEKWYTVTLH